jgi:hypothetical protein
VPTTVSRLHPSMTVHRPGWLRKGGALARLLMASSRDRSSAKLGVPFPGWSEGLTRLCDCHRRLQSRQHMNSLSDGNISLHGSCEACHKLPSQKDDWMDDGERNYFSNSKRCPLLAAGTTSYVGNSIQDSHVQIEDDARLAAAGRKSVHSLDQWHETKS